MHLLHINYLRRSLLLPVSKFPNKNTFQHSEKIFAFGAGIGMERQIKNWQFKSPRRIFRRTIGLSRNFPISRKIFLPPSRVVFLRHSLCSSSSSLRRYYLCFPLLSLSLSQEYSPFFLRTNSGKREDAIFIVRWGGIFKLHQTLSHGVCGKKKCDTHTLVSPVLPRFRMRKTFFFSFKLMQRKRCCFFSLPIAHFSSRELEIPETQRFLFFFPSLVTSLWGGKWIGGSPRPIFPPSVHLLAKMHLLGWIWQICAN